MKPGGDKIERMNADLWHEPIPAELREMARADLNRGDVTAFLVKASNEFGLLLVWRNFKVLCLLAAELRVLAVQLKTAVSNQRRALSDTSLTSADPFIVMV